MTILMVVTSHDRINAEHPTGIWLEEFAVPYLAFSSAGHHVAVASIKGGAAPIDPRSQPNAEQKIKWSKALAVLQDTIPVSALNAQDYTAIFLPGGHGTMYDLPNNPALKKLIQAMSASQKIIAAVCHGPAGLLNVTDSNNQSILRNKTVTSFTNQEEIAATMDKLMPFLLETKLRETGANFVARPNWSDHVEIDGLLVTGQNPQSSLAAAQAVIALLDKQ